MATFDEYMKRATTPGPDMKVPGCALALVNKDGIIYSSHYGTQSLDPASPLSTKPVTLSTVMWVASCTKLMTSVAAMQCVEKGLLNLDEDIAIHLPEWKEPQILTGFDAESGEPTFEKAKGKITLRHLLTHSAGFSYRELDPRIKQWTDWKGDKRAWATTSLSEGCTMPLLYEPGKGWSYGVATDWAGRLVEKVNNEQRLGDYMKEHIWGPLGMNSTTFRILERPDLLERRGEMTLRTPDGGLASSKDRFWPDHSPSDYGGSGCYSTVEDYVKLLSALLRDDGALLKEESIKTLFTPCLTPESKEALHHMLYAPYPGNQNQEVNKTITGNLPQSSGINYALGGMTVEADVGGSATGEDKARRKKGSMFWGGMPNLIWVVDRQSGIAFMYGGQLLPHGDQKAFEIFKLFEEAIYAGEVGKV